MECKSLRPLNTPCITYRIDSKHFAFADAIYYGLTLDGLTATSAPCGDRYIAGETFKSQMV